MTCKAPAAKPSPNSDNAGPIVHRPMGLPITASCDTAWNRTRVCSDASSTAIQCLITLPHSAACTTFTLMTFSQSNQFFTLIQCHHIESCCWNYVEPKLIQPVFTQWPPTAEKKRRGAEEERSRGEIWVTEKQSANSFFMRSSYCNIWP